jgi:PAS domain S-box-containing protein
MANASILVVEDQALVAKGISDKLRDLGYRVVGVVSSGTVAVQQASDLRPDLVLMDIRLKGDMDGVEAAAHIRARFDIPIIYLTAFSDDETLARARITEPFGYIVKPFRADTLHTNIEMALYKHEMDRKLKESEARYRSVVEDQAEFIVRWLPDGIRTFVNLSYCSYFGISEHEAIGSSMFSVFPKADRIELQDKIMSLTPEHPALTDEHRVLLPGGRMAWNQWTHRGVFDVQGRPTEFQSVGRDITQRVLAQQALQEAKDAAEAASHEEQERRREAERRRQIAESLRDVLRALNSDQSLDQILDFIAMQARRLLDTRAVGIYKLESEVGRWSVGAARGLLVTYVAGSDLPIGQEALRQAIVSRQPVAVPDAAAVCREGDEPLPSMQPQPPIRSWADLYQAWLAVPIIAKGEIFGGILLYYTQPRALSDEEVELAVTFSDQAALAIENSRLRDQIEQAAASAERERLARDLHDAVTQTLFSASLIAEAMPRVWQSYPEEGQRGLEELHRLTRGALSEMRTLLLELRPAALMEKPLDELLRHLTEAVTSRTRIPVALNTEGDSSLPPEAQVALYRIAQEALNNVAKHARASHATVTLHCELGRVVLEVSDDGCGFDPSDVLPDRLGMGIMRERAANIGAHLEIKSQPGAGSQVMVHWEEREARWSDGRGRPYSRFRRR